MTVRTLGKNFKNEDVNGNAKQVHTIVTPEENLHGLVIRSLHNPVYDYAYVYGPVKPLGRFDTTCVRFLADCVKFDDYFVPAGNGVYFLLPASYTVKCHVSWDFLNADGSVA